MWILQADVPGGIVPLAVGELASRVSELRDTVTVAGVGYLGVIAAERDGRAAVVVVAIAATAMEFPAGTDPAGLVAAMLRREYPQAVVEEFATVSGTGVGMQRFDRRDGPFGMNGRDRDRDAGVAQALVPFADAGLLAAVTGFCSSAADLDVARVLTAMIAGRMRVVPG
jgi:hypothetical protein